MSYEEYLRAKNKEEVHMNKYVCEECKTVYYTTGNEAPPTPNWDDGHRCSLKKES
jgi:hypothetical protein